MKDSVEILGAERIGHGIQIVRDPKILEFIREQKIPLECCPISNYLTQSFKTYEEHPLRKLMNAGIQITINSDDPGIFATTLSDDYAIAHQVHGFTVADFRKCNQTAFNASFLPEKEKFRSEFF
ncbi:Aminodeoxyfutalosine deaminase [compost metagenome]